MRRLLQLIIVLISMQGVAIAQPAPGLNNKSTYNWYFGGSNQFIRFNRVSVKAEAKTGKATPFSLGAAATVSDPGSGDLLFYTDGQQIFDATNRPMPSGTGLNGNPTGNQTVAVCPVPGQAKKYFVFTNSANNTTPGEVQVTVVDMDVFGNEISVGGAIRPSSKLGSVDGFKKNIPVLSGVSETMIIIPHGNGTDFWLITQKPDLVAQPVYQTTLISAASYNSSSFTTQSIALALPSRASHFAYHQGLKLLAVAVSNRQTDAFVLKFDDNTGQFRFEDEFLFNSAVASTNNQAIYDIEWSPDGNFIYYSVYGESLSIPGNLFQVDRRNSTISIARVLPNPVSRSLGLQLGSDDFIYHLYQEGSVTRIGRIEQPNRPASEAKYVPDVFSGADWQANQFPAVPPQSTADLSISFEFYGTCQNSPTVFFPIVSPAADSLVWELGAGEIFRGWSPVFTFESGAPATAKLTAFLNGQKKEVSLPVNIQPFQLTVNLPSDTTACRSEFPPPRGIATEENRFRVNAQISGTPTSVIWSNGQTGNVLKPDSAGYYYVIASDGSGCAAYQGVTVKEYGTTDRRANLWYFGERAGIDFTTGAVLDDSQMTAPEGCAVIGDQNGKLIFYTDGESVFNREHTVIETDIGGSKFSTQSAVIIQVPEDETLYYIFTTQANAFGSDYTVYYSLFDLKQNNGLGALVKKKIPLFSKSTERITAESGWLITHEYGNNAFRTYRITAEGIGNPVISTIGSEHLFTDPSSGEGYMKVGPNNNVVVPLKTNQGNFLEVFHFLDSLGTVTDFRRVDLNETDGQVYGIEFSGLKLFASITGTPSKLVEYYFDEDNDDALVFVQKVSNPAKIGALQIAPDGLIYIAIEGSSNLGSIGPGDEEPDPSSFIFNARPLAAGTKSLLGLPNYINQFGTGFFEPAIAYNGICLGTKTSFEGTPTDRIDQFTWAFGDGAGSIEQNVEHLYSTAGLYPVSLNLKNRCGLDTTLVEQVRIFDPPARPALPGAAVLCNGVVTLDVGQAGLRYFWTTGATTQQITTETEGSYGVLVEDPVSGCKNEAITFVVDNRPDIDLGPDLTLCEGKLGRVLNAGNPNATIVWTLNGNPFSTLPQIQPSTNVPGVYKYGLKVTDPITTCVTEEEVVFTIKPAPVFSVTPTDIATCGSADGKITLKIISPAESTFGYFLTGGTGTNESEFSRLPGIDYVFEYLASGTYSIIVGDEISGCSSSKSTGITVLNNTFSVTPASTCSTVEMDFQTTFTPPFNVKITDVFGGTKTAAITSTPFRLPRTGPGIYTAEVEKGGCILTEDNITIAALDSVKGVISAKSCLPRSVEFSASEPTAGLIYGWTGPGSISAATAASTTVAPPSSTGIYSYKLKVSAPGYCESEFTVPVIVEAGVPQISSSDICSDQVSLIAGPNQPGINYVWFKGVTAAPSNLSLFDALGDRIDLTPADNGINFVVVGISSLTGCTFPSTPFTAQIVGELKAKLTSDPACEDGRLVTFKSESNLSGVNYQWFFNGIPITGAALDTVKRRDEGLYKVQISKSTCVAEASFQMVRGPLPVGKLKAIAVICSDPDNQDPLTQQVSLDPGEFFAYEWFRNDLPLGIPDQVLVADREGSYKVLLKNSFQCVAADRTEVINDCIPKLVAPNAFRPLSNLTENTNFSIFTQFITDSFRIFIYNRWGELVFQSASPDFKWNGGYNNDSSRPLPGGTYAWVIQYVSSFRPDQGIQELRGGVLLLR